MKAIVKIGSIEQNCQDFLWEILRFGLKDCDILPLSQEDMEDIVAHVRCCLPEWEARALIGQYGLVAPGKRTLEDLGREKGCCRSRIYQLKNKALRKMRHPGRIKFLRKYSLSLLKNEYEKRGRVIDNLCEELDGMKKAQEKAFAEKSFELYQGTSIDDDILYWSVRAYHFLKNAGLMTLGDIARQSEKELLQRTHGIGRKTINEIKETLVKHGLKLRSDVAE